MQGEFKIETKKYNDKYTLIIVYLPTARHGYLHPFYRNARINLCGWGLRKNWGVLKNKRDIYKEKINKLVSSRIDKFFK